MRLRLADPERVTLAEIIPHRHDCISNSSCRRSLSRAAWWLAQVQPRRMNSLAICHLMERHFTAICRPSAPTARWQEGGAGVRLRRRLRSNAGRNVRASIERLRRDRVCHRAGTRCFRGHAPVAACLLQRAIACNAQRQIWHPWHHGQRGIRKLQFSLRLRGAESLSLRQSIENKILNTRSESSRPHQIASGKGSIFG